jgi:hypothetical protein
LISLLQNLDQSVLLPFLTHQFEVCLDRLDKAKQSPTQQRLSELGLSGPYFEEGIFCDQLKENEVQPSRPISSKMLLYNEKQIRYFKVDLLQTHDIRRIGFRFDKQDVTNIKFRVQVWAVGKTKQLVLDQICGDWIFT